MTRKGTGDKPAKTYPLKSQQWASQVISVSENTRQNGIEILFDAEPSPQLQPKLRVMGFRNSRTKTMWYADQSEEVRKFAENVKTVLPENQAGPYLPLSPSADAIKTNLEKKAFSFVLFTLKDGKTHSYVLFEPSKPRAEVLAANFAQRTFGDELLALAVLPKTHIREARTLFDEAKIIYPDGQPEQLSTHNQKEAMSDSPLKQPPRGMKILVQTILLTTNATSRKPDFSAGVELHSWDEANTWVKSKIGKHISDVYYKITWRNGDHFGGWVDLEPDEFYDNIAKPLSNHVTTYLTNYSRVDENDPFYDKEHVEYAKQLLENCLFDDIGEYTSEVNQEDQKQTSADSQKQLFNQFTDKFFKWVVDQDGSEMHPERISPTLLKKWLQEHMRGLNEEDVSYILGRYQGVQKFLKHGSKKSRLRHPFDTIYSKILKVIPGLIGYIKQGKTSGKSNVDPEGGLMALNYDFIGHDKSGHPIIALSHYFKQEGDMVADPDMQIRLIPENEIAEAMTFQDQFTYQEVYTEKDGKSFVYPKLRRDLNRFLNTWLTNIIQQGHKIDLSDEDGKEEGVIPVEVETAEEPQNQSEYKSEDFISDMHEETGDGELDDKSNFAKERNNITQSTEPNLTLLSGTPVFDPGVMAQLIHTQNYLLNAWGLSHPKKVIQQKIFNAEDLSHLHAFFNIYVHEDKPMQAKYLDLYRERYTETVNLTFQETGAPLPNVLVPVGTKEPFLSHGWRAYDMRSLLQNSYSSLTAFNNETLSSAHPVQLYLLAQLGNPSSYRIDVSQDKLIDVWRRRGKELFNILGLPTNPAYPYADLIAGYENMISLHDLLNDRNTTGDEWWIAAALYRPVANLEKAKEILDEMIQKKEQERKSYLTADEKKSRPNYKSYVEQIERTISYIEESRTVLQRYFDQLTISQQNPTDTNVNDKKVNIQRETSEEPSEKQSEEGVDLPLVNESGVYTKSATGENLEEIEVPMPKTAQYRAEIKLVKTFVGTYKQSISAEKNFGDFEGMGSSPSILSKNYLNRSAALKDALIHHKTYLERLIKSKDTVLDNEEKKNKQLSMAHKALLDYAIKNGIDLSNAPLIEKTDADENDTHSTVDPLADGDGFYTSKSAGDNFEELTVPMPNNSHYQATIFLVKTSSGQYRFGISTDSLFGEYPFLSGYPNILGKVYTTRKLALNKAIQLHKEYVQELLSNDDSAPELKAVKSKRLNLVIEALNQFAIKIGDDDFHEAHVISRRDPLANEDGEYTSFSAGKNFEELVVPMPKSSSYHATVYLVKTSAGDYREGITCGKHFGDVSYHSSFPSVKDESYPTRKSALKAALLHVEMELEVSMGRKDTILNNEATKRKRLTLAMDALKKFAKENGITLEAIPDSDEPNSGIINGLETAYWRESDNKNQGDRAEIMGITFHAGRLSDVLGAKLETFPLQVVQQIVDDLVFRYPAKISVENYAKSFAASGRGGDEQRIRLLAAYVDDMILYNDLDGHGQYPIMTYLIDMLFADSPKLADVPMQKTDRPVNNKRSKSKSQHELNREIENLIEEKDKSGAGYNEQEKNYLRQYTGSGGLISQGASGNGTLYEYYTPDELVKKMWDIAYHYGYKGGSILEPAVGTGNFLKYAPLNAAISGFETNHYAARIAQLLYPHAQIFERAFETHFFTGNIHLKGKFENPGYSLVIGNPPYGAFTGKYAGLGEKRYTGASEYDQYFTLRSLDLLKPGGLLVFLVPSYFMLSTLKYNKIKRQIISKAEWVDGYRLPKNTFQKTDVGTDILVLRKR